MATRGAPARQNIIRFGEFALDLSRQTLSRRGIRLKLQNQPLQVLALLIQHAPGVVSRDEIRRQVWGDNVYIDVEQSINFCIRQIRGVLLDSAAAPRFVETLPREGYRFIAPIDRAPEPESAAGDEFVAPKIDVAAIPFKPLIRRWLIASIATAGLAMAAIAFWLTNLDSPLSVSGVSPVTAYPGDEREPSMSPDGRQVAFSWDGEDAHRHIYVTLLGEQHPLRLTHDADEDTYPAWSPDGKQIAFIRSRTRSEGDIILVPSIGGPERILHRIRLGDTVSGAGRAMAWTSSGRWLCFTSELTPFTNHGLFLVSVESGSVRPLFDPHSVATNDSSPAFSPDGHWLVFARFFGPYHSKLLFQRLTPNLEADGKPLPILNTLGNATTPVWLPDGKCIVFLDHGGSRIMQAQIGHAARLVYATSAPFEGLTLGGSGSRLVACRHTADRDIAALPLNGLAASGNARRLVYSTASEDQPYFSPDGRFLAFRSNRGGTQEIWLADATGENPRQLTHMAPYLLGFPRWSPDSKFVVFHARRPDVAQIYTIRVEDGVMRQITHAQSPGFANASFSSDGKTIYMLNTWVNERRLYRVSATGGTPQPLWPGYEPAEAPGRNLLLYAKLEQRGIYARALSGDATKNPEIRLVEDYLPDLGRFDPVDNGIYYLGYTPSGQPRAFRFYSYASGQSVDIAPVPANYFGDTTVSPDRARLAYTTEAKGGEDLVQLDLN